MPRHKPQKQPSAEFIAELAKEVGRAIIAASTIEHDIGIIMARLLKLTKLQHRAMLIPMSISNKLTVLRQLSREFLPPNEHKAVKKLLDEIKTYAEKRNDLAHGFYGVKNGNFVLITFSGNARFSGQPTSWTPKHIRMLVQEMAISRSQLRSIEFLFPKPLKLPKIRPTIAAFQQASERE